MSHVETVHSIAGQIGMANRYGRPELAEELRGDLAVARIDSAVRKHLAAAPPLNDRQKAALRSIFEGQVSA